ncbi:hypothetical protein LOD99_8670 [Oopsacas minuta]|uniref:Amino acid transporter transmembrane domain-containing protein n=1 Tax=Oopsacas minuta TaxID=111878 RepID=A0AAV7JFM9_9METZ|nr:hypothetical protein LOD99_8670 [Oopsacas minuta]
MQCIKECLNHPKLALFYGFFDVLNLTLTVSFLIIPYWFYNAGILFGIASLALSLALGGISSFWVLEILGRASFLHRSLEYSCINKDEDKIIPTIDPDRKFEFNGLSKIIIGKIGSTLVSLVVIVTGILMIFNGIIPGSQSLSVNIPINATIFTACNSSEFDVGFLPVDSNCVNWYRLMVGIFGLLGTILSCLGSKEQIYVIVFLSVLRLVVMSYMMGFSIYIISISPGNTTIETGFITHYDMSNGMLATAAFFSLLYLPTLVPAVTHSIPNKSRLRLLIIVSLVSLTVFLSLYGVILSFAFGHNIHPNSILNLQPYTMDERLWFLRIISHIILVYPCLDGISSFMYGVILASNQTFTILTGKDYSELSKKRKIQLLNLTIYLCFSIFPTFACLFISNVSIILDVSGLVIFISNIIIPSLLQIFSNFKCRRKMILVSKKSGSQLKVILSFLFKAAFPTSDSGFYSSTFVVLCITTIASVIFAISFGYLIASFF